MICPNNVFPRLCVSRSEASGFLIVPMTTFSPSRNRTVRNFLGMFEYNLMSFMVRRTPCNLFCVDTQLVQGQREQTAMEEEEGRDLYQILRNASEDLRQYKTASYEAS